jgi:hypothetical protein
MTRQELIFLGACVLVRDPDGKSNLFRRDSIARNAMQQAIATAEMMLVEVERNSETAKVERASAVQALRRPDAHLGAVES